MAEVVDFRRLRTGWMISIREDWEPDPGFNIVRLTEDLLQVNVFCQTWDQVDSLRRQAEEAIRNRAYPRDKMSIM